MCVCVGSLKPSGHSGRAGPGTHRRKGQGVPGRPALRVAALHSGCVQQAASQRARRSRGAGCGAGGQGVGPPRNMRQERLRAAGRPGGGSPGSAARMQAVLPPRPTQYLPCLDPGYRGRYSANESRLAGFADNPTCSSSSSELSPSARAAHDINDSPAACSALCFALQWGSLAWAWPPGFPENRPKSSRTGCKPAETGKKTSRIPHHHEPPRRDAG